MTTSLESHGGKSRVVALLHCADSALADKYFFSLFWQSYLSIHASLSSRIFSGLLIPF